MKHLDVGISTETFNKMFRIIPRTLRFCGLAGWGGGGGGGAVRERGSRDVGRFRNSLC